MPTGKCKAGLNELNFGPICPAGFYAPPYEWEGEVDNKVSLQEGDGLLLSHLSSPTAGHSPVTKI